MRHRGATPSTRHDPLAFQYVAWAILNMKYVRDSRSWMETKEGMVSMGYDLERFVRAQMEGDGFGSTYEDALREIRHGWKQSHWIWYVFPQLRELGKSRMAHFYGIEDAGEAEAYLAHSVLGPHLVEISRAMLGIEGKSAQRILGPIDCVKLRSCMTLFSRMEGSDPVFREVLDKYYDGAEDEKTLQLLGL